MNLQTEPVIAVSLNAVTINAVLAVTLSLALNYVPRFTTWWGKFSGKDKRGLWVLAGFVVTFLITLFHFLGAFDAGIPEPFIWPGLITAVTAWLTFAGAGQTTYTVTNNK